MARWLLAIVLVSLLSQAQAQSGEQLLHAAHVRYEAPPGWTVEDFPDHRGTFMYVLHGANDLEASIGIELWSTPDRHDIEELLERFIASPKASGVEQSGWKRALGKTHAGARYGRVEYSQISGGFRSIESFAVVPVRSGPVVLVYTSIREADYSKHSRTALEFVESLVVPK